MEKWIYGFKTDMKMAIRTVKSGWKTYSAIFVAIFMIQMLFGIVGLSRDNSRMSERETIRADYDSHIILTSLADPDYHQIVARMQATEFPYFHLVPYSMENGSRTVGIYFHKSPAMCLETFVTEFSDLFERGVVYTETPLYDFDNAGVGDSVRHAVLLAFVGFMRCLTTLIIDQQMLLPKASTLK